MALPSFDLFTGCSQVRFDDFALGLPDQLEERIVGMAQGRLEVARLPDPSTGQDRSILGAFDILDWGVPNTARFLWTGEGRPDGRAVRVGVSFARLLHNPDTDTENSVTTWERSSLHTNPDMADILLAVSGDLDVFVREYLRVNNAEACNEWRESLGSPSSP